MASGTVQQVRCRVRSLFIAMIVGISEILRNSRGAESVTFAIVTQSPSNVRLNVILQGPVRFTDVETSLTTSGDLTDDLWRPLATSLTTSGHQWDFTNQKISVQNCRCTVMYGLEFKVLSFLMAVTRSQRGEVSKLLALQRVPPIPFMNRYL